MTDQQSVPELAAPSRGLGDRASSDGAEERTARPRWISRSSPQHLTLAALALLLGFIVAVAWWARNRGFDFTDEGVYLLSLRRPGNAFLGYTQFHLVVDFILGPVNPSIVGYRILRLALVAGSSAIFGYALHRMLHARFPAIRGHLPWRSVSILFVTVMGLLGYTWLPQTLSYNGMNAALLNGEAAAAFLLLADSGERGGANTTRSSRRRPILAALIGALMALHIFVKTPAPVGFLLIFAGLSWLLSDLQDTLKSIGWIVLGAVLTLIISVQELLGTKLSFAGLREGLLADAAEQHKPGFLWEYYKDTTRESYERALAGSPGRVIALAVVIGGPVLISLLISKRRLRGVAAWLVAAAAVWVVLAEAFRLRAQRSLYFSRGWNHDFLVSLFFAAVISAAVVAAVSLIGRLIRARHRQARQPTGPEAPPDLRGARLQLLVLGACLFALPFIGAVGTLNSLLLQSTTAGAGFGGVVILGIVGLRRQIRGAAADAVIQIVPMVLIGFIVAIQVFQGTVVDPYRLLTPLERQTETVTEVPNLRGLKVDLATHRYVTELYEASREFGMKPGDRVLAFSHMAGAVFVVDGVAPGPVVLNYPTSGFELVGCTYLEDSAEDVRSTRVMLRNLWLTTEMQACLNRIQPDFEHDFTLAAEIPNPLAPLGPYDETLRVFVRGCGNRPVVRCSGDPAG